MGFGWFIARRYLLGLRRASLISVITSLSVAGMALGVAALIVVLSVMNGFYDVVRDMLVSIDPHLRLVSASGRGLSEADAGEIAAHALTMPEVANAATYVEGKALIVMEGASEVNRVMIVRGVNADPAAHDVVAGAFDVSRRGMVLGFGLGQRLGLNPAQEGSAKVTLFSAQGLSRMLTRVFALPQLHQFHVRGLYSLESTYDNTHVFIGMQEAQALFHMPGAVTGIELRLTDLDQAALIKAKLQDIFADRGLKVQTWYDLQKALYDVMRLEKWGASLVLILISIVAAFNIVGSLTMVVIEKRRDMGVLQSMGASQRDVRRIFVLEGALVGLLGAGAGLMLGLGIVLAQKYFSLVPLAGAESFVIDAYPVSIRWLDCLLIGAVSFGLCVLAALYPAWRAASVPVAAAVKLEP
ncbi:MAG: ABC transporter permease [Bacteroidota bacterium]|nr:ABC transporter permease [Bacteroidota bacterium]MDE2835128.1 ABC transporter permease [Bacteroidota bacterium]MDE2956468.1 ABC transporter permease [Bacteroidota bacterium]